MDIEMDIEEEAKQRVRDGLCGACGAIGCTMEDSCDGFKEEVERVIKEDFGE